jgi:hypothetical protein
VAATDGEDGDDDDRYVGGNDCVLSDDDVCACRLLEGWLLI